MFDVARGTIARASVLWTRMPACVGREHLRKLVLSALAALFLLFHPCNESL